MSSTNRGYDRHVSDYYVTPIDDIKLFLNEFLKNEPSGLNGIILDPCAGGDKFNEMSYPTALQNYNDNKTKTIDIRDDSKADLNGDYLSIELEYKPNVIITNPPFNIAEDIIKKSLLDIQENGFVIMLLRLNFYGSRKRKPLFDNQMPVYSFVHHKRLSFTINGGTDSIEYQHCVWQKGNFPNFTKLKVI